MTVYFKLLLTAVFWGGTFIAGRGIAGSMGPFSAAFLRFLAASVCLLALTWHQGERLLPRRSELLPAFLLGLTGVFCYNYFFFKGLHYIGAGRASIIVATNPVLIALAASLLFGERLTPIRSIGILLSVTGALFAITRGQPDLILKGGLGMGEGCIFGCVASWVAFSLIGKRVMGAMSPMRSVTVSVLAGTVMLLVPAVWEGMPGALVSYGAKEWGGVLYLGVFGTVAGFVWYYQGIERIGPTRAGLFINFVPISALLLARVLLGEPLTSSLLTGLVLVVAGVYLTNRSAIRMQSAGTGE